MNKPIIFLDMDGVVANFSQGYKDEFGRDAYKDDPFTIQQFVSQSPNFFRYLPVIEKGEQLLRSLEKDYKVVFLTTPMHTMNNCRRDKVEWIRENLGNYDIVFSDNKADFVQDEKSILIDDMKHNLQPWQDAGGTAIDFKIKNDEILKKIDDVCNGVKRVEKLKKQIDAIDTDTNPTEKQKEAGNYKKAVINFKGIPIRIENPKGSVRWGISDRGVKWINKMNHHYGHFIHAGSGPDGDKIDVFVGPKLNASRAFVVNQVKDGMFDEHKILLGFDTVEEAEKAYLSNYQKGWDGLGSIVQTNTKKIRDWLKEGNFLEPYSI